MTTMTMPSWDRRWHEWDLEPDGSDPLPPGAVELSLDDGETWKATERTGNTVRVLVAGAAHPGPPQTGQVTLAAGSYSVLLRATEAPETITAAGGRIRIT